jgi:thioredoxin reductase
VPLELLALGREQLRPYDTVQLRSVCATQIERIDEGFTVALDDGSVASARRIVLATGVVDQLPEIEGVERLWGNGVLHCPFCHGWEVRDEPLAIYGRGRDSVEFARLLLGWSRDLVLCTDGPAGITKDERAFLDRQGIGLREERIVRLEGETGLNRIVFADGGTLEQTAMFMRPPWVLRSDLSRKLACEHADDGTVRVNEDGKTSVSGVYAAGDMITRAHQVVLAAASGARAALAIQRELVAEDYVLT